MDKPQLHFTFCHRKPERSFFWKGKQFPVCARCTGIHVGYLSFPIFTFNVATMSFPLTILLLLPTIVDGYTQAFYNRESTNFLRFWTGLAAGIAAMSLIAIVGKFIGNQILHLIN